jgi:hypothetical protein
MSFNNTKSKPVSTVELILLRHNLVAEVHLKPPPPIYPSPPWAQQPSNNPYATKGN